MVAPQWDKMMALAEFDEKAQNRARIRPTIDVITQSDNGVVSTGRDEINERSQRIETPVNITYRKMPFQENSPSNTSQNTADNLK
jgi:hypothetical protein